MAQKGEAFERVLNHVVEEESGRIWRGLSPDRAAHPLIAAARAENRGHTRQIHAASSAALAYLTQAVRHLSTWHWSHNWPAA
jgi:hypothetical protein